MLERLQDFEDKVRSRAIIAICEAAMTFPEVSLNYTFYPVDFYPRDTSLILKRFKAIFNNYIL